MHIQKDIDFQRITNAIHFIQLHFREQPDLEAVAAHVHMSPAHFHRVFSEWAGTSPKKFLRYVSLSHARSLLSRSSTSDTAHQLGLSSTSRLHDLFISIEGMTPAEYKQGGRELTIDYNFHDTLFGQIIIAATSKGICHLAYESDEARALSNLVARFPNADFVHRVHAFHQQALQALTPDAEDIAQVKLHLKGTPFQLKVWEALLKIPLGHCTTYGALATKIGQPTAARAVGTAVSQNPIAYLIPCHRVILNSGIPGGYRWTPARKTMIIGWEALQAETQR